MHRALFVLPLILPACSLIEAPESETRPVGQTSLSAAELQAAREGPVSFPDHVRPILEAKCAMCHNRSALPGRMSLASRDAAVKSGTLGAFIVPGDPDRSLLIHNLKSAHASIQAMPPVGERITRDEIEILRKWIREGAPWPAGPEGTVPTSP